MGIRKFSEAISTECQTPGMVYDIVITPEKITIELTPPSIFELNEEEAKLVEKNLHNAIELVMKTHFKDI